MQYDVAEISMTVATVGRSRVKNSGNEIVSFPRYYVLFENTSSSPVIGKYLPKMN